MIFTRLATRWNDVGFLGFAVFLYAVPARAAITNPEGNWQLIPPRSAEISSTYAGRGSAVGHLALSDFPGNAAGLIPATADIEYTASPRGITFYLSSDSGFPVLLNRHDRGDLPNVHSETQDVPGYACRQTTTFGFRFRFQSDTRMRFTLLQKIEFISTADVNNCSAYLSAIKEQLAAGTAPQPWPALAASGGIKVHRLQQLQEIDIDYLFHAHRLSPVTTLLPHCTDAPLFSVSPVDLNQINGVVPLGNLNPPGHTFPSPHLYFYLKRDNPANPLDFSAPSVSTPVRAMGGIRVTRVESSEQLSVSPTYSDYTVRYSACREAGGYYHHMPSLDPAFAAMVGPIGSDSCTTYSTGGTTYRNCSKSVSIDVPAGFVLGTAGGDMRANALDVGLRDQRVTLPLNSPAKHPSDLVNVVCAVDYMNDALKVSVQAFLGSYTGDYHRTAAPVCGGVAYDFPGTASGDWFFPGASTDHEDPHLGLVPDNTNPMLRSFSVGTSIASVPSGTYSFAPNPDSASLVNRAFELVAPGSVYCYESLGFVSGGSVGPPMARIMFLDMPDPTHLRIGSTSGVSSCGAPPFLMPADAVAFER